jgi:hypothetical protein
MFFSAAALVTMTSNSVAAVVPIGGSKQIVTYDFSLATPGSGTAPNDFHNIPFYIFDGANSGLSASANIILSPSVADTSGNGRTLLHDQSKPGSSNAHTRYVTSSQTGTSGLFTEFQGVPRTANSATTSGPGTFTRSEFAGGFIAMTKIEIDRTTAPTAYSAIFSIADWISLAMTPTGTLAATIRGTYGAGSRLDGTTNMLRPSASDPRPYHDIKLWYDIHNTPATGDDTLALYVDGVLEASQSFTLATANFSAPLSLFGPATSNSSNFLNGVKIDYLSISIPEPATMAMIAGLVAPVLFRRPTSRRA